MPALIDIQNCRLMRGDHCAFERLNLRIERAESVAIIGPNGSGKSSLLKLIGREIYPLVQPDSHVKILGKEHFNIREFRHRLGVISQDLQFSYDDNVPGLEVVISGFFDSNSLWQNFDITDQQITKATAIMSHLDIGSLRDRRYGELSTGQQKRLLLARALVHDPETLILDEPTTGLDIATSHQYLNTLSNLIKRKKAIVLVTHHLQEIPPEINRVVLLKAGRVYMDGRKEKLLVDEHLSALFGVPLSVESSNGHYQARAKVS